MTPPEAPDTQTGNAPPAVSVCPKPLEVLKTRSDFLRTARARREGTPSLMLQAHNRRDDTQNIRVGYTCSKKVGNAVARNRAKRRLREAARRVLPQTGHPGWDYVLIGRADVTAARPFDQLCNDLAAALVRLHAKK